MMKRLLSFVGCSMAFSATVHAQGGEPTPPLQFIYQVPERNDAFFGCGGVVGIDVAVQNCTSLTPTANDFTWTFEFQPTPALKVAGIDIPLVPELAVQYVVPHSQYMHFRDSRGATYLAPNQAGLRFAFGYDTYFHDRHLWGNRSMLKVGGTCLLTRPLDLNPRREGCDDLDLDNWFVKALLAKTLYSRNETRDQEIGYFQASVYHEVPDHDFASKPDTSGYVNAFNDDGLEVTFADLSFLARGPSVRVPGLPWTLDLRVGGGVGWAHQIESATSLNGNVVATLNMRDDVAFTTGAKYTRRRGSFSGLDEDPSYWTAQAYFQWRPELVVFWDHRY